MTTGQRIARKRREQGLSQEGLGELLGVSRQAIYKWESDASLPEIDKLIALSRLFSVPVGWLLGVEGQAEDPGQDRGKAAEGVPPRLKIRKPARDRWPVYVLFVLCGITLALLARTGGRIRELDRQYAQLSASINSIARSVDSQISSATGRLEAAMKEQADLTVDWSAELASADPRTNTATFRVRAVPKSYTRDMTALFIADNGYEVVESPVELGAGNVFSGEITCPLSDRISLAVSFLRDGAGETQLLKDFQDLYTESFPKLTMGSRRTHAPKDHIWPAEANQVTLYLDDRPLDAGSASNLRVGLFRGTELVQWYEPVLLRDPNVSPSYTYTAWVNPQEEEMESGVYGVGVLYTDGYGRQYVYYDTLFKYDRSVIPPFFDGIDTSKIPVSHNPDDWTF